MFIISTTQKPQNDQKGSPIKKISKALEKENEIERSEEKIVGKLRTEDVQAELQAARENMKTLEKRIRELEASMPIKYKRVKFQNYQHRKRILVKIFLSL